MTALLAPLATGITDEGKEKTAALIQEIGKNHTVLLIEHNTHIVRQVAEKVTVLYQGKVRAERPLAEIVANENVK